MAFKKLDWQDAIKILLALSASGFVFSAENKAGYISLVAMVIVWLVGFFARQYGYKTNKVTLTGLLFIVSIALTLLFQPVTLPAFPVWGGEVSVYIAAVLAWAGAVLEIGGMVFAWATANYNLLLDKVLKKLEPDQVA